MPRVAELLKIRPGEERTAVVFVALMLVTSAGTTAGGNGIQALFFARGGVPLLPVLFVALGAATFLVTLASSRARRPAREPRDDTTPLVLAAAVAVTRGLMALPLPWVFPLAWLGAGIALALQAGYVSRLMAGACDERQAVRLAPLFGAAGLLGTSLGGFATAILVPVTHAENLPLAWALALGIAYGLARLLRRTGSNHDLAPAPGALRGAVLAAGYDYVRRVPFLAWLSGAAALLSLLAFLLLQPFAAAATRLLPDADSLAAFLGMFSGLSVAAAFLAALFLANDFFARFGYLNALLVLAGLYVFGFAGLTAQAVVSAGSAFGLIVLFRTVETMWLAGIASTAYAGLFAAVPAERRAAVRAFVAGVPSQAGTALAGVILLAASFGLGPREVFAISLGVAALAVFVLARARGPHRRALAAALHAGQPDPFFQIEEPFGGPRLDAVATGIAIDRAVNGDPPVRRVAIEILGRVAQPAATDVLVEALRDEDDDVRAAALLGLRRAGACQAALEVAVCLRDREPSVRLQAIDTLQVLAPYAHGLAAQLEPWLDDTQPAVRAGVAVALLRAGAHPEAHDGLRAMLQDSDPAVRVVGLEALGACGDEGDFALVAAALNDPHAAVRRAAAAVLLPVGGARAVEPLVRALRDEDPGVRATLAQVLGKIGAPALPPVLAALSDPMRETGALAALAYLPIQEATATLQAYAQSRTGKALYYHELAARTAGNTDALRLLSESLRERAWRHGLDALRAVGLLGNRAAVELAIESLAGQAAGSRAMALEILATAGDPRITGPLQWLWEPRAAPAPAAVDRAALNAALAKALADGDAWLRACAVQAAAGAKTPELESTLAALAERDRDALVRDTAAAVLKTQVGGLSVRTLATQSPMERILLLRRVPLLAGLAPADLRHLAAIAEERVYQHGDALAQQDSPGDELFVIVSGEVRAMARQGNGTELEVGRHKAGECLGETSLVNPEPRPHSFVANGEVRVLCLNQSAFDGLLRDRPDIAIAVIRQLASRLRPRP